jgi:endonuclease/exonuclease/phosphatase family metal-dependent hydrolase
MQEVEADVFAAFEAGLAGLGYTGVHALKGANRPDGCAAFFRTSCFELITAGRMAYADGEVDGRPSGHIAQLLLFKQQEKVLAVLNTHLKWDPPETPRERQWGYRQITQAVGMLDAEATSAAGQIVCGDLNVTPESDVVATLLEAGFDYTHRRDSGARTCNSNGEPKLIDYLFYRGDLQADPVPLPAIDGRTPLPSPEQPSDHLPLLAHFR